VMSKWLNLNISTPPTIEP